MAKTERSKFWFVRVDGSKEFLEQKCGELSRSIDVEAMLATYHTGATKENPHTHFVIELKTEPQKQSFQKRIKQLFGIEKRSQYAVEVWDGNKRGGASSYLFHESEAPTICCFHFSSEDVERCKEVNEEHQKVVNINKQKASTKLVDKAVEEFTGQKQVRKEDILLFMITKIHRGENYHPGEYKLKQFVEEVEIKIADENDLENIASNLAFRLWR